MQCTQFPDNKFIDIESIILLNKYILDNNIMMNKIVISGGEPTLHNNFLDIVDMMYKNKNIKKIGIFTNNTKPDIILKVIETYSDKKLFVKIDKNKNYFFPANIAPIDIGIFDEKIVGCDSVKSCGYCLYCDNKYYLCCSGASIDRILKYNYGINNIDEFLKNDITDQYEYCKLCSYYLMPHRTFLQNSCILTNRSNKQIYSPTWKKMKDEYDANRNNSTD